MRAAVPVLLLAASFASAEDPPPIKRGPPTLMERVERDLKGAEKAFTLVTQLYIKPGNEIEFETALARAAKASLTDKGCLAYEFARDTEKVGHYVLIERWAGPAALRDHLGKEHTKSIQGTFDELSTTPRTTVIAVPVGGK
jgi:quinol monooxygenase YgiN